MSDNNPAPAAAGGEQAPAPEHIGRMSRDAAVSLLAELENEPEPQAEAAPGDDNQSVIDAPEETPAAEADDATDEATATEPDEGDDATGEAPETDAEPDEERFVHGNARTRLRDGTVTTVAELKKLADEAREYRAKVPELTAKERQLQEHAAQLAQQQQFVQQLMPAVLQAVQANIPPMPDQSLKQTDPIEYFARKDDHELGVAYLQRLHGAWEAQQLQQQKQAQDAAEAARKERIAAGQKLLMERIPDITDPKKQEVIREDFISRGREAGFTDAEINAVDEPRLVLLIHTLSQKAAAYDKLMAQKSQAEKKAKGAPPVQQPGRRVSADEAEQQALDGQLKRWRTNGRSRADAINILASLE